MLRFKRTTTTRQKGFTIIELMVVAPIVILTLGAFVTVIVSMTGDVLVSRTANATLFSVQDSLNRIEQDIKLSSGFLATSGDTANNNFALTTGQGYDNGTQIFKNVDSTTGTMLILNAIATTGNPLLSTTAYVYTKDPLNACNSAQVIQNKPQSINIIYFVKDGTLWRRTVMQSGYADTTTNWCSVPWQLPSCSPGYVATFCKANDIQLADGLGTTGFDVRYFNGSNATIENATASDTSIGVTDANRKAALQSATTASVSLTSTKTIAGRDSTQTATLRATRLDINASSLVVPVVATTPNAPVVTASTSAPTSAIFSWSPINGATSYTIEYSTNGGSSWTNGFSAQNLTSFTYSGAAHGQTVSVRVTALNGATPGTSAYGTASVTIPLWATPVMQNNWSDFNNGYSTAGYTKTSSGMVVLKGLIKGGTATSGTVILNLPAGYRPSESLIFINGTNSNVAGRVDVDSSGNVLFRVGSNVWYSLDAIRFMPSGNTFTAMSPFTGTWVNYGGIYTTAGYLTDSVGRIQMKGLVKSGAVGPIFTLPAAIKPAQHSYLPVMGNDAFAEVSLRATNSDLYFVAGNSGYVDLQLTYYPSSFSGWTSLTLNSPWAYYGSPFTTAAYTKASDGVVTVKGFVKSGANGSVIATLPATFRPAQRIMFANAATDAFGRIDVAADGTIIATAIAANTWVSLDNIHFIAEQ